MLCGVGRPMRAPHPAHPAVRQDFPRLRVGIGRPADRSQVTEYVLGSFTAEEVETVEETVMPAVAKAVHQVIGKYCLPQQPQRPAKRRRKKGAADGPAGRREEKAKERVGCTGSGGEPTSPGAEARAGTLAGAGAGDQAPGASAAAGAACSSNGAERTPSSEGAAQESAKEDTRQLGDTHGARSTDAHRAG